MLVYFYSARVRAILGGYWDGGWHRVSAEQVKAESI
jgi:hypothetical protein